MKKFLMVIIPIMSVFILLSMYSEQLLTKYYETFPDQLEKKVETIEKKLQRMEKTNPVGGDVIIIEILSSYRELIKLKPDEKKYVVKEIYYQSLFDEYMASLRKSIEFHEEYSKGKNTSISGKSSGGRKNPPNVEWSNYAPYKKIGIDQSITERDCRGLQKAFDASSKSEILYFIDWHLKNLGCYD